MLEVRLIGKFEIKSDGKPVILSSRVAQSLFAYLILTAGTLHRREKLAGMFWPDATEEKARAYLRHELWRIRKALSSKSKVDYLIADDISISFNSSSEYWLDVTVLKKRSESVSISDLIDALSVYKGQLLPDYYDEWVFQEREHLQALYEQKMGRLLELLESEKCWPDILEWSEQWISHGQGPEAAYRYLMIAYDALGDRAKVALTYERCVQALRQLDLEPSEQTRALSIKQTSKLNIPVPLTSFIGREDELKEVADLLSKSRLVTLTGSGGVGKTRLAIQVVADVLGSFPDGVWFLDLAPLSEPALVPNRLAEVLDLSLMGGSDPSITGLILGYLRSRRALVIFDNCEHVIESCAQLVHSILTSCEHLSILATSREALRVSGEIPYRVPSLEIPKRDIEFIIDELANTESIRLFTERAAVVSPGFTIGPQNALTIAQICQRLGGIPLAIELAAARVNMLVVEQILNRLDDRFSLLKGGLRTSLPRHRTLRATIEWSYELLSEKERFLFQRLAVFVGGWTLEAAEQVCCGSGLEASEILELLSELVDKSLVLVVTLDRRETGYLSSEALRYRRLETIRQYATEKFAASDEEEQIHDRHLKYFLKLAQQAERKRHSEKWIVWQQRLDDEQENIRAALDWSLRADTSMGQQLAGALSACEWWSFNSRPGEGYEWLRKLLAASAGEQTLARAKLLSGAGWVAATLDYTDQAIAFAEESFALYRQFGDKKGMAFALVILGTRAFVRSDYERAATLFQEGCALYREAGEKAGLAQALVAMGYTADAQGNFEQAEKFYEECVMLSKDLGDQNEYSGALYFMGNSAAMQGNDARAMELYEEALRIQRVVKNKNLTTWTLNEIGMVSIRSGDYERARLLLEEGLEVGRKTGKPYDIAYSLHGLGIAARLQRDFARARSLYTESLQLVQPLHLEHDVNIAEYLVGAGLVLVAEGLFEKFALMLGMGEGVAPHILRLLGQSHGMETEEFIELARAALGEEAYTAAWETGRQMSLQEAIAYALRELQ
jgi:predicted ATPase/DNA-binding SARP family transcriptional activator